MSATHAAAPVATATADPEERMARRRRQCRISQRRYRDKQGSMEYNLRLDINNLKESVERLRQARTLLETKIRYDRQLVHASALKAVEQYYAMFVHGLHDPTAGDHVRKCHDIQLSFLEAFMSPDVQMGGQSGLDVILEQWRRYTRYHSSITVELLSAHVFGADMESPIVKAIGRLVVVINRTTIERLFPHILPHEDIVQRLIGREIEYSTCTEYMFDERVRVIRQDFTVDFLSGLSTLLRDPVVTADVLREALISDSCLLGPKPIETTDVNLDEEEGDNYYEDDDEAGADGEKRNDDALTARSREHSPVAPSTTSSLGSTSSSASRYNLQFIMS